MSYSYLLSIAGREAFFFARVQSQVNVADLSVALLDILALMLLLIGLYLLFLRVKRYLSSRENTNAVRPLRGRVNVPLSALVVLPAITLFVVWFSAFRAMPSNATTLFSTPIATRSSASPSTPSLAAYIHPIKAGVLTIGSTMSSPPQTYFNAQNQPIGFDIDLINTMARRMGLQPGIVFTQYTDLLHHLQNSTIDVVVSAYPLTNTPGFIALPYLSPSETVLVSAHNPTKLLFKQLTDLCGHKIGVLMASLEDTALQNTNQKCPSTTGKITIMEQPDVDAVASALLSGMVDATYQDSPTMSYYLQRYNGKFQPLSVQPGTPEVMLVRSGNYTLYNALQFVFNQALQDNTYCGLLHKWGMAGNAIPSPFLTTSACGVA